MGSYHVEQNSRFPRCVDGRAAEVIIEQQGNQWVVAQRGDGARRENGPQFVGASLVFVRALEEVGGRGRLRAFDFVEQASRAVGLGLQIHLDDHHGEYDFAAMSDRDLVELVQRHHTGCGFAAYAWGSSADSVIREAKRRGWRLQLVVGDRAERGAVINYRPGKTFDTAAAVEAGAPRFNLDVIPARRVFEALEKTICRPGFARQAEAWMLDTYKEVVVALKGVAAPDEIEARR